jgi:hypothetical protein
MTMLERRSLLMAALGGVLLMVMPPVHAGEDTEGRLLLGLPSAWSFRPDPDRVGGRSGWIAVAPDRDWQTLDVDQHWAPQGADRQGDLWYSTMIRTPRFRPGRRVVLRFAAIRGAYQVWVDGSRTVRAAETAEANGGPVTLDVSEMVLPGAPHLVVVKVSAVGGDAGIRGPVELRRLGPLPARAPESIRVRRSIAVRQPTIVLDATVNSVGYASARRNILLQSVMYGQQREYHFYSHHLPFPDEVKKYPYGIIRRSTDNGRTWADIGTWDYIRPIDDRRRLLVGEPNFVLNPHIGQVMRIYRVCEDILGLKAWDAASPVGRSGKVMYQISHDAGLTWDREQQVAVGGCTPDDWSPGIFYGRDTAYVEYVDAKWLGQDTCIFPLILHGSPSSFAGAVLTATWTAGQISWSASSAVAIPPEWSDNGGDEPTVEVLPDGRWFMTLRAQIANTAERPSRRYYVTSADRGQIWSPVKPLTYEDGADVYNVGSLGQVVRSVKNSRYYMILHILDKPSGMAQLPRDVLQIAELDPLTLTLKRATVTVIEDGKDLPKDASKWSWYSNWYQYQDRKTGNLVLFMTGMPDEDGRHELCGVPPHAFRYEIELPEPSR